MLSRAYLQASVLGEFIFNVYMDEPFSPIIVVHNLLKAGEKALIRARCNRMQPGTIHPTLQFERDSCGTGSDCNHLGLVQGWESVGWGVLPLAWFFGFRDLSRFHHRKIPFFKKNPRSTDRFGPTQNSNLFRNLPQFHKTICWFSKSCLRFKSLRFP